MGARSGGPQRIHAAPPAARRGGVRAPHRQHPPAYLPEFPGAHAVRDAIAAGATRSGASIIVVDTGVDTGPVLAQERVPEEPDDTEHPLHERIKVVERRLLVDTVRAISLGTIDLKELSPA